MMTAHSPPVIEVSELTNYFGDQRVHDHLSLTVDKGEIIAIIGSSGCGKTTLLRSILMLRQPDEGSIKVFGSEIMNSSEKVRQQIRRRWGVMFQSGALFSSLTVLENIIFPLMELTQLSFLLAKRIALLKIVMVGLEQRVALKYPAELSGGMKKRVAMARAIALDPELVFLDEPTAGLDPESAGEFDELVLHLREALGITFVMVTHDLDTLWKVPDRVVFMGEGVVLAAEPMKKIALSQHPLIAAYFSGERSLVRFPQPAEEN